VDYSKGIKSQQFKDIVRNSEFLFARCLKHLSENAQKVMTSVEERRDIAECIYQLGVARTKQQYQKTL
jgi:hypothetical protein